MKHDISGNIDLEPFLYLALSIYFIFQINLYLLSSHVCYLLFLNSNNKKFHIFVVIIDKFETDSR